MSEDQIASPYIRTPHNREGFGVKKLNDEGVFVVKLG